jgi:hypothetical protein
MGFKKGGTISVNTASLPLSHALFRTLPPTISNLLQMDLHCTPTNDLSSASILVYSEPGDCIGWHYDNQFYKGRTVTVLVPVVVDGSDTKYEFRDGNEERGIELKEGELMAFEGLVGLVSSDDAKLIFP